MSVATPPRGSPTAPDVQVTVLMPTRDRAALLPGAIDSVLAQVFDAFELIVIDDGSTDGTADVVASYRDRDPRVRYLAQPPSGISAALNAGLACARGCAVARLDSDDRWRPDLLATLWAVLEAEPDAGVVTAVGRMMDAEGRPLPEVLGHAPRFPGDALASLVFDDWTCNVALLVRRRCLDEAGPFDEGMRAHEDWDMWLRVARRHRFVFVNRVLADVRRHPGNLTGVDSPHLEDILATRTAPLDKLFTSGDLPPHLLALRRSAYANVQLARGLRWWERGARARAIAAFRQAMALSDRRLVMAMRIAWRGWLAPRLVRLPAGAWLVGVPARLRARTRGPSRTRR